MTDHNQVEAAARFACEWLDINPDESLGGDGQNFRWMEVAETLVKPLLANHRTTPAPGDDGEAIPQYLYTGHVAEHGFPNGLPLWDELPETREGACGDVLTKSHWRGIAEFAAPALTASQGSLPADDVVEALDVLRDRIPQGISTTNSNIPDSMVVPMQTTMGELRAFVKAIDTLTKRGDST